MEHDEVEEMLFSNLSSQESRCADWDGDEGMLDAASDETIPTHDSPSPISQSLPIHEVLNVPLLGDNTAANAVQEGVTAGPTRDRAWVIMRIEAILEEIAHALLNDTQDIGITMKTRAPSTHRKPDSSQATRPSHSTQLRRIRFPGGTVDEAWKFTVLLRVFELMHRCLIKNVTMTKRDFYYRQPDLFVKQSVVDRCVDDIAYTFGVSRYLLNVTAAAKGLIAGRFTMWGTDGTAVYGMDEKEGMLLPHMQDENVFDLSGAKWILVIEKEATFRSLLASKEWSEMKSWGVALTAKGYPDLASRRFLGQLHERSPLIPMHILVDHDPDGIAIMSTYKYGSDRLAHESVTPEGKPAINLPQLRWLGVKNHQISRLPAAGRDTAAQGIADAHGLMRLTPRDRKKAVQMLNWEVCSEGGPEPRWRRELQAMLMLNIKAEMQILEELPGGLASWLLGKLGVGMGCGSWEANAQYHQ